MLPHEMEAVAADAAHEVSAAGGVKPGVFAQMREAVQASEPPSSHPVKGGKRGPKPKLALEDRLLMLLMYYHEYRTFAHVGANFGVSETPCWRIVTDLEARLLQDERFHLARKQARRSDATWQGVVVDMGECACERPAIQAHRWQEKMLPGVVAYPCAHRAEARLADR